MAIIRKRTSELSIKPKLSKSMVLTLASIGALVFLALLYFTYQYGVKAGNAQIDQDRATIGRLNNDITQLKAKLEQSNHELIIAQRHQQIQAEAYDQINAAYASSEQKNSYLGSRLDFYRSIISPQDGNAGPAIQSATLRRLDDSFEFSITLVQAIKHKHQVRGNLDVALIVNGETQATWPRDNSRSVSYQYFEQVSGKFEISELPDNAKLKVTFDLQGGDTLVREFTLADVLSSS